MSEEHPVLSASAPPAERTVVTGPEQTDVYDVWEPPADRTPRGLTVALVHGGFWREQYDRTHLAPLAAALAADGFHVANLEYPRIGMPGGGWPGTGTGVATRVTDVLADDRLPSQLVVIGHSAGGHLALWLAARPDLDERVRGVVALAPAADLRELHRLRVSNDVAVELLGAPPEADEKRWDDADPGRQHVRIPTVVLAGEQDDIVPASVIAAYRRSRVDGEPVTFTEVADADHFDLIDPGHASYFTLLAHVEQLALDLG